MLADVAAGVIVAGWEVKGVMQQQVAVALLLAVGHDTLCYNNGRFESVAYQCMHRGISMEHMDYTGKARPSKQMSPLGLTSFRSARKRCAMSSEHSYTLVGML